METIGATKAMQLKSLEGEIVTGRGLKTYERLLGLDRELLRDKTVLNFGPGLSHLQEQLGERGVAATVVNLDIIKEPLISTHDVVRYGATMTLDLYRKLLEKFGADTGKVQEMQRRFKGVKDKTFVQYDGRKIPFADGSFDHVLALWSTYQIPRGEREGVYRELMRVGKHIHIGPIGKVDFTMLLRLADTQGFDVVACESLYIRDMKRRIGLGVQMKTLEDYEAYMKSKPASERIAVPLIDDLTFAIPGVDTRLLHPIQGGSTIILKKRSEHAMGEMMGNEVYVGVGKPDGLPVAESFDKAQGEAPIDKARGETHPAVGAVKRMMAGWWERVGPGGVEKSWVNAHKNILKHINGDERQKAFEKSADTWRNVGKIFGWTSTLVDFGLSGFGLVLGVRGWKDPKGSVDTTTSLLTWVTGRDGDSVRRFTRFFDVPESVKAKGEDAIDAYKKQRDTLGGRALSTLPGVAGAGMLLAGGPSHFGAGLTAKVVELFGVVGAHGSNYVASGKAGEHAKVVGKIVEKGAQYAVEHPEEIRKTVRTVEQLRKDRVHEREMQEMRRKQDAERELQREYTLWKDSIDPGERSWYEQNHQWPPPMADFLRKRDAFMMDIRKQEQKAREKKV